MKQAGIKEQIEYVEKEEKLSDVKIIKNNIPLNQLIEIDGRQYLLTSPTECVNAMQLVLNEEQCKLIEDIYNAIYKQDFDGLDNTLMIQLYCN